MGIAGIAMLAGVLVVLALPALPSGGWLLTGLPLACLLWLWRPTRVLVFVLLGFAWCWWFAQQQLNLRLAPEWEGRDLSLTGWVASLPQIHPEYASFQFAVERVDGHTPGEGIPKLIRLSWSDMTQVPAAGEHLSVCARLKRPRGYMNPGSFDNEGFLLRHGIGANGYVVRGRTAVLADAKRFPLLRARAGIMRGIQTALKNNKFSGVAVALAIGERSGINAQQ